MLPAARPGNPSTASCRTRRPAETRQRRNWPRCRATKAVGASQDLRPGALSPPRSPATSSSSSLSGIRRRGEQRVHTSVRQTLAAWLSARSLGYRTALNVPSVDPLDLRRTVRWSQRLQPGSRSTFSSLPRHRRSVRRLNSENTMAAIDLRELAASSRSSRRRGASWNCMDAAYSGRYASSSCGQDCNGCQPRRWWTAYSSALVTDLDFANRSCLQCGAVGDEDGGVGLRVSAAQPTARAKTRSRRLASD